MKGKRLFNNSFRRFSSQVDNAVFRGGIPALMTPCHNKTPNFDALVKKGLEMIHSGMNAVVYCGSMGDWPLLTDNQRQTGVEKLAKAGVPVIVGTGAQNTKLAVEHVAHANAVGAKGLMLIPRVLSRGTSSQAQRTHFASLLAAAPTLPAVIYNSPYYGFETKADLFFNLRNEFPNLVGFKEFGGGPSLSYAAEHITSQSDDLALLVGVDTQVSHGYLNCGAVGAITGIGNALPEHVLYLLHLCEKAVQGDPTCRVKALELESALAVLSKFDEGPDLVLYYKYLMVLRGDNDYTEHFGDGDELSESQRMYIKSQFNQFLSWWENWDGKNLFPEFLRKGRSN